MRELEKAIEAIVRADEDTRVEAARAEQEEAKKTSPTSWAAVQKFDEKHHRLDVQDRDDLVRNLALTVLAVREGDITRHEIKGYSSQQGGTSYSGRKPGDPCCSSRPLTQSVDGQKVEVFVDLGLELRVPNCRSVRLSGDPGEVHDDHGGMEAVPWFVREVAGRNASLRVWTEVQKLCEPELKALRSKYDAIVLERQPAAERVAEKHARKLLKSRARAARPDKVAKREAEARHRARESLSNLLGAGCKAVLDKWSPSELLGYLRLCQTEGHVLRELMGWSSKLPLGSEKITVEDVETAIEMARVKDVMES